MTISCGFNLLIIQDKHLSSNVFICKFLTIFYAALGKGLYEILPIVQDNVHVWIVSNFFSKMELYSYILNQLYISKPF